jgi:hypothetical protein
MTDAQCIEAAEREAREYRRFVRSATRTQALGAVSRATDGCPWARRGALLLLGKIQPATNQ